jgi:4-amino-4-deoxy-L-arabinose transferase-like glycosyltransferase
MNPPRPATTLPVWIVTVLTALLHFAVAGRYDIFRNELYFIICGRHPAFGYADQPPLVPLIAAATQFFGETVWLLRAPAALAAVALVPLTAAFARLAGGGPKAALLAALAAALAPGLAALTTTLGTPTFEPLLWTACAYGIARAHFEGDRRALVWAGAIAGVAMECKYGIALWLIALAAGMLATSARRIFAWRECWLGIALAAALSAPSLIWQQANGWPFFAVILQHGEAGTNFTGTPLHFELHQLFALNIVLAPLWIAGVDAPFMLDRLKPARFLAIAFVVATVLVEGLHGKDYYLYPAYPAMFAMGAAACGAIANWLAGAWMALAFAQALLLAPIIYPLFTPAHLARFLDRTHLRPPPQEAAAIGAPLTQVFSDQFGWRELEAKVASVYRGLPPQQRATAAIWARNYGEAAAIDFYGAKDGLPPALSGQNQYFLWGPRGFDGAVTIIVNGDVARWTKVCATLERAATFGADYAMPYENGRPILVCRGMHPALPDLWPALKRFQ